MNNINYAILNFGRQYQGILKIVGAVLSILLALGTFIHFINISGYMGMSYNPHILEVFYTICMFFGPLLLMAGFGVLGAMLLTKPKHIMANAAIAAIALGEFLSVLEDLFYYAWQSGMYYSYIYSYPYIPMILLAVLVTAAWVFPALIGLTKNETKFQNLTLIFIIIPCALMIIDLFFRAIFSILFFSDISYNFLEMVLLAVVFVLLLSSDERSAMDCIREMSAANANQRWQDAHKIQPGQTAYDAYAQPQQQTPAENNDYNFDPLTGEPIRKEPEPEYNFDPMTGEPIRKEPEPTYNFDPLTGEPLRKE
ncbi:MAG: hypothetical protein IJC82_06935 [Firmicutes bacterium]|nr:hypothetical protein [Bacillota bacterium]